MMNSKQALIAKYTLFLAITYGIEYGFQLYTNSLDLAALTRLDAVWIRLIPNAITIVLNLLTLLIVLPDISRLKLSAPYVILATILFRPLGIFAFLIYAVIRDKNEPANEPIEGILDR